MSPTTPPRAAPGVEQLNLARRSARRKRAATLAGVFDGTFTLADVVDYASTEDGAPLRRVKLRELLLSQPGVKPSQAEAKLSTLRSVLGLASDFPARQMTVGWLLDNRTNGQRFDAFLDISGKREEPWPGFPFTASPLGATA